MAKTKFVAQTDAKCEVKITKCYGKVIIGTEINETRDKMSLRGQDSPISSTSR